MRRGSSKPSKQRKASSAPLWSARRKRLSAPLSPELREKYGMRSFPIRKGDRVRILRGDHAGEEGKVTRVDYRACRVSIEGIKRERVDGRTVPIPVHPSKTMITELALDDKLRRVRLEGLAPSSSA